MCKEAVSYLGSGHWKPTAKVQGRLEKMMRFHAYHGMLYSRPGVDLSLNRPVRLRAFISSVLVSHLLAPLKVDANE